jgi:hypothetical protein
MISNSVNVLFANVDATAIEMWATTDVPISAPQPASIVMVAPENHGHRRKCSLTLLLRLSLVP